MKYKVQVWIYFRHLEESPKGTLRFLILKTNSKRGSFWQPVTGGVDEGENNDLAALREAQEETGLTFIKSPTRLGSPFEFQSSRGEEVQEQTYSLQTQDSATLPLVKLDPHEHTDYLWATSQEAYQLVQFPSNQGMLALLLEELKEK